MKETESYFKHLIEIDSFLLYPNSKKMCILFLTFIIFILVYIHSLPDISILDYTISIRFKGLRRFFCLKNILCFLYIFNGAFGRGSSRTIFTQIEISLLDWQIMYFPPKISTHPIVKF